MACREIGRAMGLKLAPGNEGQNNDCLSFQGDIANERSKLDYPNNFTYTNMPGDHSRNMLRDGYADSNPDHGPELELAGTLAEAADEKRILHEASYDLEVAAYGENHDPAKISKIQIRVDGVLEVDHNCGSATTCALPNAYGFDPDELGLDVGAHEVEVRAIDNAGFAAQEMLIAYVPDRTGTGHLDTAIYEEPIEEELVDPEDYVTPDNQLSVNVASGNALITALDVSLKEGMTAGEIVRYYNSVRPQEPGAFGIGWRLGIGEDVKLTNGGHGSRILHTPSGFRSLFVADAGGECMYVAAPGTSAQLNRIPDTGGVHELFVPETEQTYVFDPQGRLTEIRSPSGPVVLSYTAGKLSRLSFEDGSEDIVVTRNPAGSIILIERVGQSDPLASYEYFNGRLVRYTSVYGDELEYTYDSSGVLEGIDQPSGAATELETDADGLAEMVDPDPAEPGEIEFTYEPTSEPDGTSVTEISDADGTTEYEIDPSGAVETASAGVAPPVIEIDATVPDEIQDPIDPQEPIAIEIDAYDNSGIEWVGVVIDGSLHDDEIADPCSNPPCSSVSETIVVDPSEFLPGDYSGHVVVIDEQGDRAEEAFTFRVPEQAGCEGEDEEWEAPATRQPHEIDEDDVEAAIDFRELHGLEADKSFVESTFGDPEAVDAELRWGVPLSDQDEEELDFRSNDMADAMYSIDDYGETQSEYAGMYIDHQSDGLATVLFTGNLAHHEQALSQVFEYPERLQVAAAEHSIAELEAVREAIEEDRDELRDLLIKVIYTSRSVTENRVLVSVTEPTESGPDADLLQLVEAEALLEARYGSMIQAEHSVDEPGGQPRRLRGGRRVRTIHHTLTDGCTVGYGTVRRVFRGPPNRQYAVQRRGLLTTGHCYVGSQATEWWYYRCDACAGRLVGKVRPNPTKAVDAMNINIRDNPRRRVPWRIRAGASKSLPVGSVMGRWPIEKTSACIFYRQSRKRCGVVSNDGAGVDENFQGWGTSGEAIHVKHKECCGVVGDSGSSVWRPKKGHAQALGIWMGTHTSFPRKKRAIVQPWAGIKRRYPLMVIAKSPRFK